MWWVQKRSRGANLLIQAREELARTHEQGLACCGDFMSCKMG